MHHPKITYAREQIKSIQYEIVKILKLGDKKKYKQLRQKLELMMKILKRHEMNYQPKI